MIPAATDGEGPVVWRPAQRRPQNVLVVRFAVAIIRVTHIRTGVVPRGAPGQVGGQMIIQTQ
ncbi:hypothetical protein D3C80_1928820 [compost metagenome]